MSASAASLALAWALRRRRFARRRAAASGAGERRVSERSRSMAKL
ncbi:MAG: hypothetical protein FJX47_12540 [Alphaproteobacteria bacterium]|nr:hypothetical protein [Alphaproteobacteria bacterium]